MNRCDEWGMRQERAGTQKWIRHSSVDVSEGNERGAQSERDPCTL